MGVRDKITERMEEALDRENEKVETEICKEKPERKKHEGVLVVDVLLAVAIIGIVLMMLGAILRDVFHVGPCAPQDGAQTAEPFPTIYVAQPEKTARKTHSEPEETGPSETSQPARNIVTMAKTRSEETQEPSESQQVWDWEVDGQAYALDPETGEVAIPVEWFDTGCGCNDLDLVWETFVYHEEIGLSEDLQCVLWNDCLQYGVPYEIALALIQTESGFDVNADNGICRGLCALHRLYWPYELPPGENIEEGMKLLGSYYKKYGDWGAALTAYAYGHDNGKRSYAALIFNRAEKWAVICGK